MLDRLLLISMLSLPASLAAIASDAGTAMIITMQGRTAQCITPVVINEINGELKTLSQQGFVLDAGTHSLGGWAERDPENCPALRGRDHYSVPPLRATFEAGKTYYLGMDQSSKNKEDWRIVVWKTE